MIVHAFTREVEDANHHKIRQTIYYRVEYQPEMRCYCWYKLPDPEGSAHHVRPSVQT